MTRIDFEMNVGGFIDGLNDAQDAIATGTKVGIQDVLDDWQREARDDAPIKTGTLRRNIEVELKADGLESVGEISANTYEDGFNYSYWQHEVRGVRFLATPAQRDGDRWARMIEDSIQAEVRKAGW